MSGMSRARRPVSGSNRDCEAEPLPRSMLRVTYYDAVHAAGGVPLLLPPIEDPAAIAAMLERVDGLVLTGGDDIDPTHFGEELHPSCKLLSRRRQDFDLALARAALERRAPVLAICCGMQAVNVVRGGSLIQDIPSAVAAPLAHRAVPTGAPAPEHEVAIEPGTRLREIVGADRIVANSAHHQSCGRMGADLRLSARAADRLIEAFEDPDHPFLLGVQWHPERIAARAPHGALFRALVAAAAAHGRAQ